MLVQSLMIIVAVLAVVDIVGAALLYMEYYARKMEELEDEVPTKGKRLMLPSMGAGTSCAVPTQMYKIDHY